jgi:hypothetical protein
MGRMSTAVLALAMVVTAACEAPAPSEAAVDPTATQTASAAASATATELIASTTPLEAGRYTRSGFAPPLTFAVDDGWRAVQLFDGFFDVQQLVGTPDVIAVQFANVGGVYGADGPAATSDPDSAVEILGTNAGLTVLETSESRIGGLTGAQVTVENAGDAHAEVIDVPPGPLGIDPGRRLWMAFFETDEGLLAIMVGGSVDRWDEALLTAEPVLESIRVGASR